MSFRFHKIPFVQSLHCRGEKQELTEQTPSWVLESRPFFNHCHLGEPVYGNQGTNEIASATIPCMIPTILPIETERLILRSYRETDLDALAELLSNPDVMQYLFEGPMGRDEVAKTLRHRIPMQRIEKEGDRLALGVTRRESDALIGTVNLTLRSKDHRQGEVGYVFHPRHQGKGFATEAIRAIISAGFEEIGMHRVYGRCDARNIASAKLMERLGMRREAHFIENEWFKGEWGSEFVYAILKREWPRTAPDSAAVPNTPM